MCDQQNKLKNETNIVIVDHLEVEILGFEMRAWQNISEVIIDMSRSESLIERNKILILFKPLGLKYPHISQET